MSSFSSWGRWLVFVLIVVSALGIIIALLGGTPLVAVLFAALGLVGFATLRYQSWIKDCIQLLESGSKVIETSKGLVEYALYGAAGPVILFVHGQPGGYDQVGQLGEVAAQHGFRMISLSRPGYLRTPIDVGRSPEEQADAIAALLDAHGIFRVSVVSLSGGGPAALQFALRHLARCQALVAISAVSRPKSPPMDIVGRLLSSRLFTSNVASWLIGEAVKLRPALLAHVLVPDASSRADILSDPRKLSTLIAIAQSGIQLSAQRRAGSRNDVEQFSNMPVYLVESIHVPTLVIHGTDDEQVPYTHGLFIAQRVPGAELYSIEGGTHIVFVTHAEQVLSRLFTFLSEHGQDMLVQSK
jgi:pimeloyl-ACP methyl ester carboxylesterase